MQTETSCLLMLATLYDVDDDVDYDSNKISTGGLERIMISSLLRSFGLAGFGSIILLENEKKVKFRHSNSQNVPQGEK